MIGEPGTSKTCGNCGYWNSDLGGKKTYRCPECKIELDRDVNGARNNMIALIHGNVELLKAVMLRRLARVCVFTYAC